MEYECLNDSFKFNPLVKYNSFLKLILFLFHTFYITFVNYISPSLYRFATPLFGRVNDIAGETDSPVLLSICDKIQLLFKIVFTFLP